MYQCVVFDVDGTIIDTEKSIINSLKKLLKSETGMDYSADELSFALGIPGAIALKKFDIYSETAIQKWNEYSKDFRDDIRVFPDFEETLKKLYSLKITTGIVTSRTKEELTDDFYPFGLQSYFDYVICADDTKLHKPNPDPLLKCLELTQSSPAATIYIGDTIYDLQCARNAGIDFGLALWGARNPDLDTPLKLNHPKDILDIVARRN